MAETKSIEKSSYSFFSKVNDFLKTCLPRGDDLTPKLARLRISGPVWFLAILLNVFVLLKFLSPLVIKNALLPVMLPVGIIASLFAEINDFFGLIQLVTQMSADLQAGTKTALEILAGLGTKLGAMLTVTGIFVIALALQNIYRSAHMINSLFKKEWTNALKEALAITNPLFAFFVANLVIFHWVFNQKMLIVALLTVFAGPEIATVFANTGDMATIINSLVKVTSWGVIFVLSLHLLMIAFLYIFLYKLQCLLVARALSNNFFKETSKNLEKMSSYTFRKVNLKITPPKYILKGPDSAGRYVGTDNICAMHREDGIIYVVYSGETDGMFTNFYIAVLGSIKYRKRGRKIVLSSKSVAIPGPCRTDTTCDTLLNIIMSNGFYESLDRILNLPISKLDKMQVGSMKLSSGGFWDL